MKRRLLKSMCSLVVAGGVILGFSSQRADAVPITFDFSGTVGGVPASLAGTFSSGQTITGSYTFESSTPDTSPSSLPNRGIYSGTLIDLAFTIGTNTWTQTPSSTNNFIFVDNETTYDRYQVTTNSLSGPSVGTFTPQTFTLVLDDLTATAFSSTALPSALPNLSNFSFASWIFIFDDGSTSLPTLSGQLNSITLAPVPEPATILLLGSGLIGLVGFRRKFTRK